MFIKHFCNNTYQGEYPLESVCEDNSISNGSLFFIKGIQYRVTNIMLRKNCEIVVESVKTKSNLPSIKLL